MRGTDADGIATTLRELDRERYFATLILAEPFRADIQALYAALAEIAVISERVHEPMPGEIRLQWWADLLDGAARGEASQNPVAAALLDVIARRQLPTEPLTRLIAARRFDLYQDPMPDVETFEGYAGEVASVPLHLAATILNDGRTPRNGDAAGHLGVALSYFGHVRAFGFNAARGRIFLPLSLLFEAGVREADIFGQKDTPELRAALDRARALGADHLGKARKALGEVPRILRPAYAQIAMVDRGEAGNPFAPQRPRADWLKLLRLIGFGLRLS